MTNLSVTSPVSPVRSNFSYQRLIFDCRWHEVDKFNSVEAHLFDLAYELKLGQLSARKHRLKAVAADAGFHIFSPQSMYPLRKLTALPISFSGSSPTSRSIVRKPL